MRACAAAVWKRAARNEKGAEAQEREEREYIGIGRARGDAGERGEGEAGGEDAGAARSSEGAVAQRARHAARTGDAKE